MARCPNCKTPAHGNRLRCTDCGRKLPKRRKPAHRAILDVPYARWEAAYGPVCGICGAEAKTRRLHRDHCHTTGEPRGILCFRCNTALPNRVTLEWMRRAVAYLERERVTL